MEKDKVFDEAHGFEGGFWLVLGVNDGGGQVVMDLWGWPELGTMFRGLWWWWWWSGWRVAWVRVLVCFVICCYFATSSLRR